MSVVFTVGYESTDIDRFVATLKAAGIEQIADVRAVAISRKKGFSKRILAERLKDEGIAYLHLIDLGDPKPGREAARAGRYHEFLRIYYAHLDTDAAQTALQELLIAVEEKATCLLCFEQDPRTCHRSIVASAVSDELGWVTQHLYANNPEKYVRNSHQMPRFHPHKSIAAAE